MISRRDLRRLKAVHICKELMKLFIVERIASLFRRLRRWRRRAVAGNDNDVDIAKVFTLGVADKAHFYLDCKRLQSSRREKHEMKICQKCLERKTAEIELQIEGRLADADNE